MKLEQMVPDLERKVARLEGHLTHLIWLVDELKKDMPDAMDIEYLSRRLEDLENGHRLESRVEDLEEAADNLEFRLAKLEAAKSEEDGDGK